MGPIQTFAELADMVRRRAGLLVVIATVGAFLSAVFALSLPHVYASSEVIQIESPRITDDLAPTTVNGSSARRMQLIEQQLMARGAILATIGKFGLFADLPALSDDEKVALFRESVTIEGVAAAREGATDDGTISILRITAQLGSPEDAQTVAHELATQTLQLSTRARREQTRATLDFFVAEEQAMIATVAELEQEIADIRSRNDIAMTGRLELNQAEMATINAAISDLDRSLITVQSDLEAVDPNSQRPATLRQIRDLTQQLATLQEQKAYFAQRARDLQQTMSGSAEVEGRIAILQRRLTQYQDQLEEISARRSEAAIGNRVEENRQAERLEILEYATLPEDPIKPSRRKIALAGTLASIFAALAVVFLLELRRPVLRFGAQMERELGILPAAIIPTLKSAKAPRKSTGLGKWVGGLLLRLFALGVAWAKKRLNKVKDRLPV